ncbi:MAG: hypothetical protein J0G29_02580 [Alphaproteobacteria bacterium]|mgnify:CR=1 FL=1|nr:hypothetical protein [Alphaproteobacteria bacterium]OJV47172.1 MAG: hypothetical protein BGO28_01900 [Alphaproteobacteria bacterium 43-37]
MNKISRVLIYTSLFFACTAQAQKSTLHIQISAYVPPRCEITLQDSKVIDGQLVVKTVERCNTQKDLKITENRTPIKYERQYNSSSDQTTYVADASRSANSPYFLVVQAK